MSDKELRPCPFCGGKAIAEESKFGLNVIHCESCEERTIALHMNNAVKAWNSRSNIETFEKDYHKAINSHHDTTDQLEESK